MDASTPALAGRLKFKHPVHYNVLEDCLEAVDTATARRDRLEAHIEAALPAWSLAPVVQALQALRGVAMLVAVTLVAELGDITRFTKPSQLMAYLGLFRLKTRAAAGGAKVVSPRRTTRRHGTC